MLPLGAPVRSAAGAEVDHLCVRAGQDLIVGFGEVNRLKSVWGADAYEWRPERWMEAFPPSVGEARIAGPFANL